MVHTDGRPTIASSWEVEYIERYREPSHLRDPKMKAPPKHDLCKQLRRATRESIERMDG